MIAIPGEVIRRYPRFSLYNSPYPAHRRGRAIDLYPGEEIAPSPVAGEVLDVRTVRAPSRPYAAEHDHLVLVDSGEHVARLLHVDPGVAPGDRVAVGDPLGSTVRSGYFAPWVDDHVHLEFRDADADPYRASGALALEPDVAVESVPWDGTGTVVETGETYAVLDRPAHPAPGERFAALAADEGPALDGGLVHYAGGGAYAATPGGEPPGDAPRTLSLLGCEVGTADGRDVDWAAVELRANGRRLVGLSLAPARDGLGAKLLRPDHALAVGDRIGVTVRPSDDPVRLDRGADGRA